jgi:hypothetical protein
VQPQPKRRGFFSRIFGIGRDRDSKGQDVSTKKKQ